MPSTLQTSEALLREALEECLKVLAEIHDNPMSRINYEKVRDTYQYAARVLRETK